MQGPTVGSGQIGWFGSRVIGGAAGMAGYDTVQGGGWFEQYMQGV